MSSDAANNYDKDKPQHGIMNCALCKKQTEEPATLPCLHTFCRKCLRAYFKELDGSEPKCNVCGAVFSCSSEKEIDDLPTDEFVKRLLGCECENYEDKSCSLCSSEATEKCFHCNQFLCEQDTEKHRKIPSIMSHTIVSLKEYQCMSAVERLSLYPTKHGEYAVEHFCSTCDKPVCMKCMLDHDSSSHNLHSMDEVIESDKRELTEEQYFVATQYKKLTKAEKKVFETREKLVEAKEKALNIIAERANELRKHIDKLENELADDITAKYKTKVEALDRQLDEMDCRMNELDVATIYIDALLQCKNSEVFLDASKNWYEQFKVKKVDYMVVEFEPVENSYLKVEVGEKAIEETVTSDMICSVFCTSAVACNSQLIGCPDEAEIGSEVKFSVVIKSNDNSKVALNGTSPDVEVACPNYQKMNLNGETSSQSKFKYEWCPSSLGKHTLYARIFDDDVKGSPMVINVHPKNSKNHHQQEKNGSRRSQKKSGSATKSSKSKQPEPKKASWKK